MYISTDFSSLNEILPATVQGTIRHTIILKISDPNDSLSTDPIVMDTASGEKIKMTELPVDSVANTRFFFAELPVQDWPIQFNAKKNAATPLSSLALKALNGPNAQGHESMEDTSIYWTIDGFGYDTYIVEYHAPTPVVGG